MKQSLEVTRREFVEAVALLGAGAAAGQVAVVPGFAQGVAAGAEPLPPAKDVAMGPVFPYGAVYFRKSNPPAADWARDHRTAAQVGMNTFRHWFLWSAIEVAPGKFDWADYDRMMDLAAANGLKEIGRAHV